MIETIFYTICLLIVVPLFTYLMAKAATFGYYSAKRMFENLPTKDNEKKEIDE